nr:hypothetical protein [Micromonospora sonchi]
MPEAVAHACEASDVLVQLSNLFRHPLAQLGVAGTRDEETRDLRQGEPGSLRTTDERDPVDDVGAECPA